MGRDLGGEIRLDVLFKLKMHFIKIRLNKLSFSQLSHIKDLYIKKFKVTSDDGDSYSQILNLKYSKMSLE